MEWLSALVFSESLVFSSSAKTFFKNWQVYLKCTIEDGFMRFFEKVY